MLNSLIGQIDFTDKQALKRVVDNSIDELNARLDNFKNLLTQTEEECAEIEKELEVYRSEQKFEQELDESEAEYELRLQELNKLRALSKSGANVGITAEDEAEMKKLATEAETRKKTEGVWQRRMEDAFNESVMCINHLKKDYQKDLFYLEHLKRIQKKLAEEETDLAVLQKQWGVLFQTES